MGTTPSELGITSTSQVQIHLPLLAYGLLAADAFSVTYLHNNTAPLLARGGREGEREGEKEREREGKRKRRKEKEEREGEKPKFFFALKSCPNQTMHVSQQLLHVCLFTPGDSSLSLIRAFFLPVS